MYRARVQPPLDYRAQGQAARSEADVDYMCHGQCGAMAISLPDT